MATARDRLNPKPKPKNNEADGTMTLRVSPPQVKVGSPQVKVDVASPQLNMDSSQLAEALGPLGQALAQVAQQQTAILQAIGQQNEILRQLAAKNPDIKVPAPVVKMAQRPRSFRVELEKEDGETVAMDITASPS